MIMAQYIDKSALIAEIERLIKKNELYLDDKVSDEIRFQKTGAYSVLCDLRHFLDTLEVKEVDLESEFNSFLDNKEGHPRMWHSDEQIEWAKNIAKHFFELGLKAQIMTSNIIL